MSPVLWIATHYLLMSLMTLAAYGLDKRASTRRRRRVSEAKLHWLELLGGWPGAYLGSVVFKHKTIKRSFRFKRLAMTVLNIGLVAAAIYCLQPWAG